MKKNRTTTTARKTVYNDPKFLPAPADTAKRRQKKTTVAAPRSQAQHGPRVLGGSPPAKQVRRSSRLLQQRLPPQVPLTAAEYFMKKDDRKPESSSPIIEFTTTTRNRSIFKEIKERFAKSQQRYLALSQLPNRTFSSDLSERIGSKLYLTDLDYFKDKIAREIALINDIISGVRTAPDHDTMAQYGKRRRDPDTGDSNGDGENKLKSFPFVPQSGWVFQTPPNRKLNFNRATGHDDKMQPAVIETRRDGDKVVYEMNHNVSVNYDNLTCTNVPIDRRYMVKVDCFSGQGGNKENFNFRPDLMSQDRAGDGRLEEAQFDVVDSDPYELEHHFLGLTCRPKKSVNYLPRIYTSQNGPIRKRKINIFDDTSNGNSSFDHFEEHHQATTDVVARESGDDTNGMLLYNFNDSEETFSFQFESTSHFRHQSHVGNIVVTNVGGNCNGNMDNETTTTDFNFQPNFDL